MKPYQIQLIFAALAATGLNAQDETPPHDRRPPPVLFAALDADENGKISIAEIRSAADALAKLDQNGDGELSPEEIHPQGPPPADQNSEVE